MNESLERLLDKLTGHKNRLDKLRPFSPGAISKLKEYYDVEWTYNSNAIEGNTLTLGETRLVILDGVTIGGKSVREHLEAINHKKAIDALEQFVTTHHPIDEPHLLRLHSLILREIDDANAGRYRTSQVYISGSSHVPPEAGAVPHLMADMIGDIQKKIGKGTEHPVWLAADAHYQLAKIHPFIDGNGRVSRLLMNLILIQQGYAPAVISFAQRAEYIQSLEKANAGDHDPFYLLVAEAEEISLLRYIRAVGG